VRKKEARNLQVFEEEPARSPDFSRTERKCETKAARKCEQEVGGLRTIRHQVSFVIQFWFKDRGNDVATEETARNRVLSHTEYVHVMINVTFVMFCLNIKENCEWRATKTFGFELYRVYFGLRKIGRNVCREFGKVKIKKKRKKYKQLNSLKKPVILFAFQTIFDNTGCFRS
jgi:hypothetical protein